MPKNLWILAFLFALPMSANDIRVARGRLYNVEKSTNWVSVRGTCKAVHTNGITMQIWELIQSGRVTFERVPTRRVFIENYPVDRELPRDEFRIAVMRVGVTNVAGESLEHYDYGRPATTNDIAKLKPRAN